MKPVIEIKQLGKKYHIRSSESYLALRDVISSSIKNIFKPGVKHEDFWALQDINLQIEQGDRIGIIGKNGAGKSTLLKILSRVTWPTTGEAIIRGRLASLLEVGTGFHPELTGRENIYLNGSILGLKKKEIQKQFDAIVDFSGVEKFLDTPLKHYSSGMQLRLAFAVAAHLEPEVLLIDEVLAVGDMEFQKKCIGKMEEVSKQHGRTILFVSHNLKAVNDFCQHTIWLEKGMIREQGVTHSILSSYVNSLNTTGIKTVRSLHETKKHIYLSDISIVDINRSKQYSFEFRKKVGVLLNITNNSWVSGFEIGFALNTPLKGRILINIMKFAPLKINSTNQFILWLPSEELTPNVYTIDISIMDNENVMDIVTTFASFEIQVAATKFESIDYDYGIIEKELSWEKLD